MLPVMSAETWDALAGLFGGPPGYDEIPVEVADHILLAWPPMVECLRRELGSLQGRTVLDVGCGAGHFTRKLCQLGARAVGIDPSRAMIERALTRVREGLEFRCGTVASLPPDERYDAVTALMVFPFVEDLPPLLRDLNRHLRPDGLLVLATYNPGFVRTLLRDGKRFRDFDSLDTPRRGQLDMTDEHALPVFIRYADEYAMLLEEIGFRTVFEARPPFTTEFLIHHPQPFRTHVPEFLIMGFRKGPTAAEAGGTA